MHDPSTTEQGEWLAPSDALTRFVPGEPSEGALAPAGEAGPALRYGFRIGQRALLTQPGVSGEVVVSPTIYRVPLAPPWLVGVVNQRGNIVPVFELATWLGQREPERDGAPIVLVLGKGEAAAGLCVDGLPKAIVPGESSVPASTLEALPEAAAGFLRPAFRQEGTDWLELDHIGLFGSLAAGAAREAATQTAEGQT